jgi:hypothetical protein
MKSGSIYVGICGAINGGTLKEANMVSESRSAKRAMVGGGMGRGAVVENNFVKCVSFHIPTVRFAAEVPTNFAVP